MGTQHRGENPASCYTRGANVSSLRRRELAGVVARVLEVNVARFELRRESAGFAVDRSNGLHRDRRDTE